MAAGREHVDPMIGVAGVAEDLLGLLEPVVESLPVESHCDHRLRLKIDWATSPEIVASVARGQVAEFICKTGGSAWSVFSAFVKQRQYITLDGPISR